MDKGIADISKIREILDQKTAKQLSDATGIKLSSIKKWKSGERSVEKMNLADAITLTSYASKNLTAEINIWQES